MFTVFAAMVVFSASVALLGFALARSSRTGCCNCRRAQSVMARCSAVTLAADQKQCDTLLQLKARDAAESPPLA